MNEIIEEIKLTKEQGSTAEQKVEDKNGTVSKLHTEHSKTVDPLIEFKLSRKTSSPATSVQQIVQENSDKSPLGPGGILKNIRLEAKLTQEDVAKELRLAVRHIEYLENDSFEKFAAIAFYVGYLRNYSKLLDLDSDKMVAKFYAVYKVKPELKANQYKTIKESTWQDIWPIKLLLGKDQNKIEKLKNIKLVVLIAVTMAVFSVIWWLLSTSGNSVDTSNSSLNSNSNELHIEQLAPEEVDHLLPSQPVIASTSEQAPKQVSKRSKLDDYS